MTRSIKIRPAQPMDAEEIVQLARPYDVTFDAHKLEFSFALPDSSAYWVALAEDDGAMADNDAIGVVHIVGFIVARALGPNQPRLVGADWFLTDNNLDSSEVIVATMRLLEVALGDMPALFTVPQKTSPVVLEILSSHGFQRTGETTSNSHCPQLIELIR
ncbi:hypothetical protein JOD55_000086 [Arcanobacterium pluranimalium]|uniref:hypothetical protein n=1 Tax=Arcanobacterium pluranimalium TaxID=108028 RepID=UPI00195E5924|nr:hypothetical protein [Arcanobacterium pluranimalium]MBM7824259.1 hypothetical protein [Arcanobacterium pluranimalium]